MRKDMMLMAAGLAPFLMGAAIRFGIPIIDKALMAITGMTQILALYYSLFDIFYAAITPAMFCFVAAMVIRVTGHGDLIDSAACVEPGIFFLFTWAIASLFSALAKAFDHGAKLQQESDETL